MRFVSPSLDVRLPAGRSTTGCWSATSHCRRGTHAGWSTRSSPDCRRSETLHVAVQPPPLQAQPAQPPVGGGTAAATRWPSSPPASNSPTAPLPATATITASAEPSAPRAKPPPAPQIAPAATTVGAATRLAALNAASERSVAAVRMPANRLRGSHRCQPSSPTRNRAPPAPSSSTPSSADAGTAARVPVPQDVRRQPTASYRSTSPRMNASTAA